MLCVVRCCLITYSLVLRVRFFVCFFFRCVPLFVVCCLLLVVRCSLFVRCSLLVACCVLLVVVFFWLRVACYLLFVVTC